MRGVQFTGAVTLIAELGDLTRFEHPRQLMSDLGLPPSEDSSGERRRQGSITKAGNTFARRALVEGAWAYRYPAKVSRHLHMRLEQFRRPSRNRLESPGPLVQALSTPHGTWKKCQPGGGGHRPRNGGLHLGHRPQGANDALTLRGHDGATPIVRRHAPTIGREAASVWRHPGRRSAAARTPRASIEAGARRTHVGGTPPTAISRINRRDDWLPLVRLSA